MVRIYIGELTMGYGMQSSQGNAMRGPTGTMKQKIPKGYAEASLQQFTPEQMQLFQDMFSHVGPESFTSRIAGGDQSAFGEMEAPALREFSGQLGNLASRFSGMGMGARKSSGFQNTATAASSNFAQDLASKRMGLQRQAIQDLMGMSKDLLGQRPFEKGLVEKQKPWWQELLMGLGQTGAKAATESMFKGAAIPGLGG